MFSLEHKLLKFNLNVALCCFVTMYYYFKFNDCGCLICNRLDCTEFEDFVVNYLHETQTSVFMLLSRITN